MAVRWYEIKKTLVTLHRVGITEEEGVDPKEEAINCAANDGGMIDCISVDYEATEMAYGPNAKDED